MSPKRLARALRRIATTEAELAAGEHARVEMPGLTPIDRAADREMVQLRGVVTALTLEPRNGMPWLEAEFSDGSGAITLTWMGRRGIAGIVAGRELAVSGRLSNTDGKRRIYNPRYELLD